MGRYWGVQVGVLVAGLAAAGQARSQARELALAEDAGHFEVGLHARSMKASARAEQAAWLTLSVPLEKLALPRSAQPPSPATPPTLAAPPSTSTATPMPTAQVEATSKPAQVTLAQVRALSELSRRATIVALGVVGTAAERRRLDALSARARGSALLPELRLRALRNSDQALRWIPTTDDPYRITQANGTGLVLEGSATFRLDRLLFAREELVVERLRQQAGEARLKLEARVLTAVLALFRARELACAAEADEAAARQQALKTLELFAELDNLTAGWFSEQAASFGRAVWGFPEAVLAVCSAPEPPPSPASTNPVASLENSE